MAARLGIEGLEVGEGPRGKGEGRREAAVAFGGEKPGTEDPALVVFSGGTAFNSVARHVKRVLTERVTHVLPVSDDGGSTAEICRVLGGPAVGDIRSRCLRLADSSTAEARAVSALLAHRLPSHAGDFPLSGDGACDPAKQEWSRIVEGEHPLWDGISEPYKNTIRAFLVHFHANILRHATERFDFSNGSVGNFFFAGARIFFRSLEAAIFLYSRVSGIPEGSLVLPAVCTENRLTLGAELRDGTVIRGQHEISHPNVEVSPCMSAGRRADVDKEGASFQVLQSPIERVMYLSYEGMTYEHEIHLEMNPRVGAQVAKSEGIVYATGSLYTSLCPSLILKGVGECVAKAKAHKIMLLNGWHDREIHGYSAIDCVNAVTSSLNRVKSGNSNGGCYSGNGELQFEPRSYISTLLVPEGSAVYCPSVDDAALADLGIEVAVVKSVKYRPQQLEPGPDAAADGVGEVFRCMFDKDALVQAIAETLEKPTPAL
mmetsp:Transcript_9760/g.24957  ORF Transcript_9760/g.24957 Transcript_9760/m.24957 type:complete len:487 (+) Transcript_9760:1-1461(+)